MPLSNGLWHGKINLLQKKCTTPKILLDQNQGETNGDLQHFSMTCQLRDNILKFDRPVPRYTSYPTAPHFTTIQDSSIYTSWLQTIPEHSSLSLYLHVPFCPKLCWYCGCHTKITKRYAPVEDYTHLMMREIDLLSEKISSSHIVKNIHFGGGSPGLLRACDFSSIMKKLREKFQIAKDAEIAIELDPRGVTEGRVASYAEHNVNRVSLGVQDFDDKVLESVNRQQPFHLSYKAVELLRSYGISQINLDLIYGLPYQNIETAKNAIEKALLLTPDRIAFFGYAHVPWMKKHMRLIDETTLPDTPLRFDLFEAGSRALQKAGYQAIGIDHFAKPDDPLSIAAKKKTLRRNFQGYVTEDTDALIGIGASSIGKLPQGYIQNAVNMPDYKKHILNGELPAGKFCLFSKEDRIHSHVIERLMCDFEIDLNAVAEKYSLPGQYFENSIKTLSMYEQEKFLEIDGNHIQIKPECRAIARLVASAFDAYIPVHFETPKHSKAI